MYSLNLYKAAVYGSGIGVLFLGAFGMLWSFTGIMGLQGWGGVYAYAIMAPGLALIIGGISLLSASRKMGTFGEQDEEALAKEGKRLGFWANLIFLIQGVSIGLTIYILNQVGHTEWIPVVIAVIVGLHFYPLAVVFKIAKYHLTGTLFLLLGLISWLLDSPSLSLIGFGSAFILYITGTWIWLGGRKYYVSANAENVT
ncbi:hypothetical protein BTS2_1760 [Bacillus sp. TS-2]|nr:hypothetical protein BTS2_1760 [Bacillus sp. TS-2]